MPARRPAAKRVLSQLSRLSVCAPQVVAHRLGRMATAGPVLSARDRQEFTGMVLEKQVAFAQSIQAMWLAGARAQQQLLTAWANALVLPTRGQPLGGARQARQIHQAGLEVLSQGLAPIERKASANARRLSRRKR